MEILVFISMVASFIVSIVIFICIIVIATSLSRIQKQLDEGIGTYEIKVTNTGQRINPFHTDTGQSRLYLFDEWASSTGMTIEQVENAVEQGRLKTREVNGQTYIIPPRG